MTGVALSLVLVAAVAHATWNLLLKQGPPEAGFVWLFQLLAFLVLTPPAVVALIVARGTLDGPVALFAVGSGLLQATYFWLLQSGYRHGDMSLVYPLARGAGPLFATAGAIALLGERPGPVALCGTLAIAVGIVLLVGGPVERLRVDRTAATYALVNGVVIGAYTLWDSHAVNRLDASPVIYLWIATLFMTLAVTPAAARDRTTIARLCRTAWRRALAVAVLASLAYVLVLFALQLSPVSYVAPSREISILFGTIIGTRLLAEGSSRRRLIAAGAMVVGVVLLAIG